jgi:hypothetical protein
VPTRSWATALAIAVVVTALLLGRAAWEPGRGDVDGGVLAPPPDPGPFA